MDVSLFLKSLVKENTEKTRSHHINIYTFTDN